MSAAAKPPTIEVLDRVDTPGRSFRVQRERVVDEDGVRMRVSPAIYVPKIGGDWVRDRSVGVKRCEMRTVIAALKVALEDEPIVEALTGEWLQEAA